jgi:hypothetical protein
MGSMGDFQMAEIFLRNPTEEKRIALQNTLKEKPLMLMMFAGPLT